MCDPIGAISLAALVLSTCYIYICEYAAAPDEARRLGTEVLALAGLLISVKAISSSSEDQTAVDSLQAALDGCQQALQDVSDRLEKQSEYCHQSPAAAQKTGAMAIKQRNNSGGSGYSGETKNCSEYCLDCLCRVRLNPTIP